MNGEKARHLPPPEASGNVVPSSAVISPSCNDQTKGRTRNPSNATGVNNEEKNERPRAPLKVRMFQREIAYRNSLQHGP